MSLTKILQSSGLAAVAAWLVWAPVAAAPCSRYEHRGLIPGMTSKQVQALMGKGQQQARGRRSIVRYVTETATIQVEFDAQIGRKNARVTRIESRIPERFLTYDELVRTLVETVGAPTEGLPEAGTRATGPVRWNDPECAVEVTTSRHLPEWWEPGQGPAVQVEIRAIARAAAARVPPVAARRAAARTPAVAPPPASANATPTPAPAGVTSPAPGSTRAGDGDPGSELARAVEPVVEPPVEEPAASDTGPADTVATDADATDAGTDIRQASTDTAEDTTEPLSPPTVAAASQAGGDFKPPIARHKPAPRFPAVARDAGGQVVLGVLVNEFGRVDDVTVSSSSGSKLLRDAAKRAVKRWRYQPATRDGVPIPVWTTVSIGFDSDDR